MRTAVSVVVCSAALSVASTASAAFVEYSDLASFIADTSATSASGSLALPHSAPDFTWGSVRVTIPSGSTMALGEWTSRLDAEFAISGSENVNYDFAAPVFAAGFRFVEPQFDPNVNAPFSESTFRVTLLNAGSAVHTFDVTRPNDVATFIGIAGDAAFDRMEVREIAGGVENEFFGEVFTAIPAPGAASLALTGVLLNNRRRRR
ncbi:MAG: hypothetical protein J0L61_06510 [Planctomycetes bacterium]|nr:hypothetical protein [Planctomycetota bacterium]